MTDVLPRHIESTAREWLGYFPGLVIEGARQVGKSTLTTLIKYPDAVVANLDDPSVLLAARNDPTGFVDQGRSQQLVIDEIQRCPELTLAVKASIDADRRPGRFILTGSSSLLRVRGTSDSLAGRVGRLTLYGLSHGEATRTPDDFAAAVTHDPASLLAATNGLKRHQYADLIARGAYPRIYDAPVRVRNAWLDSYVDNIVGRDLPDLRRMVDSARAMSVLRTLAGRQSAELVQAKLAHETSIPAGTVTGYVDLLHDVGLISSIPPWTPNLAKREIGRPKTFITDSALALRLARLTSQQLASIPYGEALGSFLVAYVAAELLRQRAWSACDYQLFHWRDANSGEVDLVMEFDDGSVVALEVKSAQSFGANMFRGLTYMRDALGSRFRAGIVLNTAKSGLRFGDRLYGAPISTLWEIPR
ncbi:MAG: ATP-binding protein [Cellulomonadaceae bacterium]|jgi:predicted AAA+ superfamily ATPase|nr:ATP-binding protein [Cellulomonadaceae bacterium]